jgi:hypothetical protein
MDNNKIQTSIIVDKIKSLNTTFTIIIVILSIILVVGIALAIIFYLDYDNAVKNESPLCLTGSCAEASSNCGYIPFKVEDDKFICKSDLFTSRAPNVTTTSN